MSKFDIIRKYQEKAYNFTQFIINAEKEDLLNITNTVEYSELIEALTKLNDIGLTVKNVSDKEW